jgi:hypothetical protein
MTLKIRAYFEAMRAGPDEMVVLWRYCDRLVVRDSSGRLRDIERDGGVIKTGEMEVVASNYGPERAIG